MLTWRVIAAALALSSVSGNLTTCRSPGDAGKGPAASSEAANVDLPGVQTSDLTVREKREWSGLVSELLAPCPDQPVDLAQCVKEARDCKSCAPAASFLVRMVRRGKTRSQIETAYKLRFGHDQVKQISLGDSPAKGPASASVTIVEWADFECPFCAATDPAFAKLLESYPEGVRLVFKNYPLSIHEHAEKAARAAMAANKQGKFWDLHRLMFEATRKDMKLDEPTLQKLAKQAGLDMQRFADDAGSEAVADAVARDRKQGNALDLKGTPLIYINGRHFDLDYFDVREDLEPWIQLELELAGKPSRAKPAPAPSAPPKAAPSGLAKEP
jgi:hypothetical protein